MGKLIVDIEGCRRDRGHALVALYDSADAFPDPEHRGRTARGAIAQGRSQVVFLDLPADRYAICVVHDEDDSGTLDTDMLGLPTEGWGFSNNPRVTLGAPRFSQCAFAHGEDDTHLTVELNYSFRQGR